MKYVIECREAEQVGSCWERLLTTYPTLLAALRAMWEHRKSPAGYSCRHRILDQDGCDRTEEAYAYIDPQEVPS